LLAYLAVTRAAGPHARDALAVLLWPDYDQHHARATLRRNISALNKALDGEWLEADRETIGLSASPDFWLDVDQFQQRLAECRSHGHPEAELCPACLTALTAAAALYHQDFMAGFTLRDSPGFDEWQFFQTESLRRDLAGALERLVSGVAAQAKYEQAVNYARRWLALDPLHEPAHRQLMLLYARSGQRSAALHQYQKCVQILNAELGVSPLEETTELYQTIKQNRALPPQTELPLASASAGQETPPVAGKGAGWVGSYPLVGRSTEWAALLEAYNRIGPDGRVIVLKGEPGIGKTRLAEEFLAHVRGQGGVIIAARCYEGETTLAYAPFIEGLRPVIAEPSRLDQLKSLPAHWLSEVTRLLPELTGLLRAASGSAGIGMIDQALPLTFDDPGAKSRFFEGINQALLNLCTGSLSAAPASAGPAGVLFFDDLHWADDASLDLLTYLGRRLRGRRLCILLTWRDEPISSGHRLRHLLTEVQRTGAATVLTLSRLNQSAVTALVQAMAANGLALPERLAERLYQETEGLPFFLTEYLTTITKEASLAEAEIWSMPGSVRDLLLSRLAGISEIGWQLLATAAVIGRSFDFETLRAVSGRAEEEVVTALEALISQALISEMTDDLSKSGPVYDYGHQKLRALVYEETSLARRRLLHRRMAETLAGHAHGQRETGAVAAQIARHYRLAGQETQAAAYFKLAGDRDRRLFANAEALIHFQTALELGHPEGGFIHEAIGDLQTLLAEYPAALTSYETAAAIIRSEATGSQADVERPGPGSAASGASRLTLANLEHKLGNVYHRRGEWDLAERHFQTALNMSGSDPNVSKRAQIYADWSRTVHHRGETGRALELARQALNLAETGNDIRALTQVHNILGILANSDHNLATAFYHLQQSLELAQSLGDPIARVAALNNLALACRANDEIERALELTETALGLCVAQGDRHHEAALHNNLADLFHAAGRSEAAMAHLKQAVTIFAEIGAEAGTPHPEIWKMVTW
jgi:DNA-binding SARP family transcriptional activator